MLTRFEQFSSMIFGIYRSIQRLERDEMIKYGYKGAFAQYLVTLIQYPEGITSTRLCEICDKDKAAVSRIVSEMQEKGLIVRECEGAGTYRGKIKLTSHGIQIAKNVCDAVRATVAATGQTMTEEERVLFYQTLEKLFVKFESLAKDGIPTIEV